MSIDDLVADIKPVDASSIEAALQRQQRLTKPPGSLGRLEALSLQASGVLGSERPVIRRKALIIAAADHGVVAEGVSGYSQEVTAQVVMNFLEGGAAINVRARMASVDLTIVDAGVATPLPDHPGLRVVAGCCGLLLSVEARGTLRVVPPCRVSRRRDVFGLALRSLVRRLSLAQT